MKFRNLLMIVKKILPLITVLCAISFPLVASENELTNEKKSKSSIYLSWQGTTEEWAECAKELRAVTNLERLPSTFDFGFIDCFDIAGKLEETCNNAADELSNTPQSLLPQNFNQTLKILQNQANLRELETKLDRLNVSSVIAFANAYVDNADVLVNTDPLLKNLYYKKAVFNYYYVRYLLLQNTGKRFKDVMNSKKNCFTHDGLLGILKEFFDLSNTEKAESSNLYACALLAHNICYIYKADPDIYLIKNANQKQRSGKNKIVSDKEKKTRFKQISYFLFEQGYELKEKGRVVEAMYKYSSACDFAEKMLNVGFKVPNCLLVGKNIQINVKELEDLICFGQNALEEAYQLSGVDGVISRIQQPTFYRLMELCGQLNQDNCRLFTEEKKFLYLKMIVQAMDEKWFGVSKENELSVNALHVNMAWQSSHNAPDRETEMEYCIKASKLLPKIPETKNIFEYYVWELEQDYKQAQFSNTQRKSKHSVECEALIRMFRHLSILRSIGKSDEVKALTDKINEDKKEAKEKQKKRPISHEEMVQKILAEKKIHEEMQEELKKEKERIKAEKERRTSVVINSSETLPYWHSFSEKDTTLSQKQIRNEIRIIEEKREEKAAKKESKKIDTEISDNKISESIEIVGDMKPSTPIVIPEKIQQALKAHRDTFELIFTRHNKENGAYNNDVSVKRDAFLSMIAAIGGSCSVDQGKGSHSLVRLVLGDSIIDIGVLDQGLAYILERQMSRAHSTGTMTLSWPKRVRGYNRRFLLPEQVENARLILAANGLVPDLVFKEKALCNINKNHQITNK